MTQLINSCSTSSIKMATVGTRPNIRIEIQNNLVEPMEVDESDFEDGEIEEESTKENKLTDQTANAQTWTNKEAESTTPSDIFNVTEHEKLQDRANRFGLHSDDTNNFTNDDLQKLYATLGISAINEKDVRLEAIHMRGTDEMSTEDVFEYFRKYNPTCVEWIDDGSCNVVWQQKLAAATALYLISKSIKGMPVEGPCDPFTKHTLNDNNECRSILLANKTREVELAKDEADMDINDNCKDDDTVNLNDITIPIPPGYWRLGVEHPKTKFPLLRFAYKTDKKPLKAERFSEYYKKYGNPNFGGLKGLISGSCRNKFKGIFDRNKDIKKAPVTDSKNPWGDLAENWDADEKFSEQIYVQQPQVIVDAEPDLKPSPNAPKSEVLKRLGTKRNHDTETELPEEKIVKKVSKVPRMRMYADEEEVKIKRKKQLLEMKLKHKVVDLPPPINDLRNMLGNAKKMDMLDQLVTHQNEADLGTKLKNRKRKEEEILNSVRTLGSTTSTRETRVRHSHKEKSTRRRSSPVQERRHLDGSPIRSSRHSYVKSHYKNKLHSDRYERPQRHRSHSRERVDSRKPKSKVAVVIKTQKRPAVASTIWSRITPKKERLKTASERLQSRRDSSSSSESSSSNSSSSSSGSVSSDSSSDSEGDSNDDEAVIPKSTVSIPIQRPGFISAPSPAVGDRKSPLRIEINNDHFKEE